MTEPSMRMPPDLPQPFYFGSPLEPLFGHLHWPAAGAPPGIPVLLCAAYGHESMSTHRSLRILAERLAADGSACLRFDYLGCGDSADPAADNPLPGLAHWTRDIGLALDQLKALTGAPQVMLVGFRLGATLAALAAHSRADVAGLVAVAPVLKGRAYLRECKALGLSTLARTGLACSAAPDTIESGGFMLSAADIAFLGTVDLLKLPTRAAPALLILENDHLPPDARWHEQQAALGAEVQRNPLAGYEAMMQVPHFAQVPPDLIDQIANWAAALPRMETRVAAGPPQLASSITLPALGVHERALWLQAASPISAVLSRPLSSQTRADGKDRRGVLILNTGGEHRIGCGRMYTQWARQWASRGWTVMRLDLPGLGNSPPRTGERDNQIHLRHATQDVQAAMKHLQDQHGVTEFHLIGLCSGAFHSLAAAFQGAALRSVTAINQMVYFWQEDMPQFGAANEANVVAITRGLRSSLLEPARWRKLVKGQVRVRLILGALNQRLRQKAKLRLRSLPSWLGGAPGNDLNDALLGAGARSVQMHLVFSAGEPGLVLLQEQGAKALAQLSDRQRLTLTVMPGTDHTFTQIASQRRLFETVDQGLRASSQPDA
jgi:pimeloyl-ACP methyl ester carboxylesterase